MSLLLDALKKSGRGQNPVADSGSSPPDTASGLTLEATPARPAQGRGADSRDSGRNLFASKTAVSAKGKMKLGIVPITLIGATLFGSAYGYYVWRQISGPAVAVRYTKTQPVPVPVQPSPQVAVNTLPPLAQTSAPPVEQVQIAQRPAVRAHRHAPRQTQPFAIEKHQQVDTISPLLQEAYRAYGNGDLTAAQRDYAEVLQQDGKNRDALLGLAAIAQQQAQDPLAAQYYGQLLALDPRDALANAGMSALGKGGQSGKESHLKLLLEQQPQSAALHFALGNLYAEQSRWPEAQQAYFDAYSLQPDAAQYAYNLAVGLDHLGQVKLASQYYRRALQLDTSGNANFDHSQTQQRLDELKAP